MREKRLVPANEQHAGTADHTVSTVTTRRIFASEPEFQRAVEELAKDLNWDVFHVPVRAYEVGIPYSGFPDLILRYRDDDGCTMIIAELKYVEEPRNVDEGRRLELQKQFLRDFANYNIPVFLFYSSDWEYINWVLKGGPPDGTGDIIEPSSSISQSKGLQEAKWDDNRVVSRFLQEIFDYHHTNRGALAELRRMDPNKPDAATYWRLMAKADRLGCPSAETKWALVLHGMALMAPNIDSATPVGEALFDGGDNQRKQAYYSDVRFKRLLNARGEMLRSLLSEMFRMMSATGQAFDWYEMASFIVNDNEDSLEAARLKVARDYYATEYHRNN